MSEDTNRVSSFAKILVRYIVKHISWLYLTVIIVLTFGLIYVLGTVNQEKVVVEDEPAEQIYTRSEVDELLHSQELRIQNLEKQVEQLKNNP